MHRSLDAARGCLLGLACGDALGRPVEFSTPARIEQEYGTVREMVGHGTHGQPAGTITDDTELALCIARSLAEEGEFNGADMSDRFIDWYQSGPFDIGIMTSDALRAIESGTHWRQAGHDIWAQRAEGNNAGNGSLMRCAPYAIRYARSPIELDAISRQSSAITHADPRCTHACSVLNRILAMLILLDEAQARALPVDPLLGVVNNPLFGLPDAIEAALEPGLNGLSPAELGNSGYVVTTLQAGLYYGLTADSAEEAIIDAVNAGGDTDTIGAVAGAVAGARFGASNLPERWLEDLDCVDELEQLAQTLLEHREEQTNRDAATSDSRNPPTRPVYLSHRADPPVPEGVDLPAMAGGHRPRPEPRYLPAEPPTDLTTTDAVWFDWTARLQLALEFGYPVAARTDDAHDDAQAVVNALADELRVRLPEYATATTLEELPEQDRDRIERLLTEGATALEMAGDMILDLRSQAGDKFTHLHGFLGAASRNAPFRSEGLADDVSVNDPQIDELCEFGLQFTQLAAAHLQIVTMLNSEHDDVQTIRETAQSAHETAHRGLQAVAAAGLRHPEIDYEYWRQQQPLSDS